MLVLLLVVVIMCEVLGQVAADCCPLLIPACCYCSMAYGNGGADPRCVCCSEAVTAAASHSCTSHLLLSVTVTWLVFPRAPIVPPRFPPSTVAVVRLQDSACVACVPYEAHHAPPFGGSSDGGGRQVSVQSAEHYVYCCWTVLRTGEVRGELSHSICIWAAK